MCSIKVEMLQQLSHIIGLKEFKFSKPHDQLFIYFPLLLNLKSSFEMFDILN